MPGIIPSQSDAGAVVVPNPLAHNVFVLPAGFSMSCTYTALPSNCNARILPEQINALVSEMIALAYCWDPTGSWSCGDLNNLCQTFTVYSDDVNAQLVNYGARITALEGGGVEGMRIAYANGTLHIQVFPFLATTVIHDWDTVQIPNGDITYNAGTGAFTVGKAGVWCLSAYINGNQSTTFERIIAYKNGTPVCIQDNRNDNNHQRGESLCTILPLAINDVITFRLIVESESNSGMFTLQDGRVSITLLGSI